MNLPNAEEIERIFARYNIAKCARCGCYGPHKEYAGFVLCEDCLKFCVDFASLYDKDTWTCDCGGNKNG